MLFHRWMMNGVQSIPLPYLHTWSINHITYWQVAKTTILNHLWEGSLLCRVVCLQSAKFLLFYSSLQYGEKAWVKWWRIRWMSHGRQCSWISHASSGAFLEQVLDVLDYGNCQDSISSRVRVIMKAQPLLSLPVADINYFIIRLGLFFNSSRYNSYTTQFSHLGYTI